MATRRITPPWHYLHDASIPSLQSYELTRLNHAANIRREIGALIEQWIEDTAQALLARWIREDRDVVRSPAGSPELKPQPELPFGQSASSEQALRSAARPMKFALRSRAVGGS